MNTRTIALLTTALLLGFISSAISGCQSESSSPPPVEEADLALPEVAIPEAESQVDEAGEPESADAPASEGDSSSEQDRAEVAAEALGEPTPQDEAEQSEQSEQAEPANEAAPANESAEREAEPAEETEKPAKEEKAEQPAEGESAPQEEAAESATEKSEAGPSEAAQSAKSEPAQPETAKPEAEASEAESTEAATEQSEAEASAQLDTREPELAAVDKSANAPIEPGDWPQWGGTSYRNNTPIAENIPTEWEIGGFDRQTNEWIPDNAKNIKWVAALGSQSYGNAVVADGRVYVGTNNGASWLDRYPSNIDLGCLLCFRESDGEFLWQDSSEKLPTGRVHDWPLQGICCAPYVEGDRVWFVTSRGEVKCVDAEGFYDGEDDGPVQARWARVFDTMSSGDSEEDIVGPAVEGLNEGELTQQLRELFSARGVELPEEVEVTVEEAEKQWTLTATLDESERKLRVELAGPKLSAFKQITPDDKHESDVVWVYDMMNELGVSQHNMASCSVTALGDILFVNTSNGVDASHKNLPAPEAPSFMAMDKNTGEVFWTDASPGQNILHGQWSSPTVAELGGVPQVIFAAGDGWIYSFRADKGQDGKPELLWKFDANPKESEWILGGRGTRNNIIGTPVVYDGLVYVAVGQDPEHGEGVGHLWCIDPTKRGDVSPQLAMKVEEDERVPIPHRRLQAVVPEDGEVAVDNPNSAVIWHYSQYDQDGDGEIDFTEQMHRSCGTVAIKDDLLFIADFSGLFHCLDAKTGDVHWTYDMFAAAWGSALIVEDYVYVGDEDGDVSIFKLSADPEVAMTEIDGELHPLNTDENFYQTNMGSSVYTTPIVANGVLYISSRDHLFAIAEEESAE